jgi:hypothetical protein
MREKKNVILVLGRGDTPKKKKEAHEERSEELEEEKLPLSGAVVLWLCELCELCVGEYIYGSQWARTTVLVTKS